MLKMENRCLCWPRAAGLGSLLLSKPLSKVKQISVVFLEASPSCTSHQLQTWGKKVKLKEKTNKTLQTQRDPIKLEVFL